MVPRGRHVADALGALCIDVDINGQASKVPRSVAWFVATKGPAMRRGIFHHRKKLPIMKASESLLALKVPGAGVRFSGKLFCSLLYSAMSFSQELTS